MQYRRFGKLDWKVSALGFGAMRLPLTDADQAHINEPEAIRMIRYAIDNGVNYVDTAYVYHSGQSERLLGKALQDGYRARMRLATKLPVRLVQNAADFDRIFNEQLQRLQTDRIDFYLMHGLTGESWAKARDLGVLSWAEVQMQNGRIGHLGFSFHDEYAAFEKIVDDYDNWTFCQLQYNYVDIEHQAGRRGVEYAAARGMAVVVMEPLRGGLIARPQKQVTDIFESAQPRRSPVEWAFQWVWDQPEVSLALSGMSTMEQVVENVALASRSGGKHLTRDERSMIDRVRQTYRSMIAVPCTGCKYCVPCPNGVEIPDIFQLYNNASMFNEPRLMRNYYSYFFKEEQKADQCIECGECLEKCPQHIEIPEHLKKAHELLGAKPG